MTDNKYIIDFEPKFLHDEKINVETVQNIEEIIKRAITLAFKNLSNVINHDIQKYPLTNKCDLVRNELERILTEWQINVIPLETQDILDENVLGHSILLITDEKTGKRYISDPTYSQFFLKNKCSESKFLINEEMILLAPDPGYYYLMNPNNVMFAKAVLENGYFELTEENIKIYFDSFYKTRRGMSAYINLFVNPVEIDGKTYLNALEKEANKKAPCL